MKKIFPKIIFFVLLVSLVLNLGYNKNEVLAQEPKPIICEERKEITLFGLTLKQPLAENELEIPIGRATDKTEFVAKQTISVLRTLVEAATKEAEAADEMLILVDQCSDEKCEPVCKESIETYPCNPNLYCGDTCPPGTDPANLIVCQNVPIPACPGTGGLSVCCTKKCSKIICEPKPCQGQACPTAEIAAAFDEIEAQAKIIEQTKDKINDFFAGRFIPITLFAIQYGLDSIEDLANYIGIPDWLSWVLGFVSGTLDEISKQICSLLEEYFPSQAANLCISITEMDIKEKLAKSRYRLADCVIRPYEIEKIMRGEITGKWLLSCQNILGAKIPVHSFLDGQAGIPEEGCYGNTYCYVKKEVEKEYLEEWPCAEDYFCCQ